MVAPLPALTLSSNIRNCQPSFFYDSTTFYNEILFNKAEKPHLFVYHVGEICGVPPPPQY